MFVFSTFSFAYVSVCFPKEWPGAFFSPFYSKKFGFKTTEVGRVSQSAVRGIPHRAAIVLEI